MGACVPALVCAWVWVWGVCVCGPQLGFINQDTVSNSMELSPSAFYRNRTGLGAAGLRVFLTCIARVKKTPASEANFFTLKSMTPFGIRAEENPPDQLRWCSEQRTNVGRVILFTDARKSPHRPALKGPAAPAAWPPIMAALHNKPQMRWKIHGDNHYITKITMLLISTKVPIRSRVVPLSSSHFPPVHRIP